MKVYISGAITGTTGFIPRFSEAEARLSNLGFTVINPSNLSIAFPPLKYSTYLELCSTLLREADAIYMLPGWKSSKGATCERALAAALDLDEVIISDYGVSVRKIAEE